MSEFLQLTSYLQRPHMSVITPQLLPQTLCLAVHVCVRACVVLFAFKTGV